MLDFGFWIFGDFYVSYDGGPSYVIYIYPTYVDMATNLRVPYPFVSSIMIYDAVLVWYVILVRLVSIVYPFARKNPYNDGISRGDIYTLECLGFAFGDPFGYLDNTYIHLPPVRVGGEA